MSETMFYKPNELIAVIEQVQVNRLAKHIGNYLLKYAQEQIKFCNHQGNLFEINIVEINVLANIASRDYKIIENSLEKLMQPVTIRDKDNPKNYHKIVPIYEIKVNAELGVYQYRLADTMIDLLQQTDYFTKLDLHEFNDFDSKHTIVIYEWLKRYENAPKIPIISLLDLRKITHTADKKTYDNFSHIQIRILDVVVSEINNKTPYFVSYESIKERASRRPKVTGVQFKLQKKQIIDVPVEQQLKHYNQYEDLLKSFKVTFVELTIEDVYKADCQYTFDTLVLFARQLEEKQYSPKTNDDFHQWLEDRTVKYKGYDKKDSKIKDCYKYLQSLTRKNNTSNEITGTLPTSLLPPDLLKKDNEPDNEYVIEAKAQYGKFCYADYIQYMYDMYEANKEVGTQNLIEPFLCREDY